MKVIFINRRWLFVIWLSIGLLLAAIYIFKLREDNSLHTLFSPAYDKVILIDAGHGGFDPGAVSPGGIREDEINLKLALKLRQQLEHEGVKVIMTRKNSEALAKNKTNDMKKRAQIIRDNNPDIIISLHLNTFSESQYYGAQTFYLAGSEEGKKLAECIQERLISVLNRDNNRQAKSIQGMMVLKISNSPSVIVECGFLSNPQEEKLLQEDYYQERIAWSIYSGIIKYLTAE